MTTPRALTNTVITMPVPVIVAGKPTMPALRGHAGTTSTIRKIDYGGPPPKRKRGSGGDGGGAAGDPAGLWTVDDLPDPGDFHNGWYWLGEPSGADGTLGIRDHARQWAASSDSSVPHAWHSQFPFKPSVTHHDSYLFGGGVVHHPKGVNFNSFYVEHMWLELANQTPQPFTWVIAALAASWPNPVQHLLDAGKKPPRRYSVGELGWPHKLPENLGYRSAIELRDHRIDLAASSNPGKTLRLHHPVPHTPRMFIGVFDGDSSRVGIFGPEGKRLRRGAIYGGGGHRFYVIGRRQGWIDRDRASHLLVFEMRFWRKALDPDQLDHEYHDIAERWHFGKYTRGG